MKILFISVHNGHSATILGKKCPFHFLASSSWPSAKQLAYYGHCELYNSLCVVALFSGKLKSNCVVISKNTYYKTLDMLFCSLPLVDFSTITFSHCIFLIKNALRLPCCMPNLVLCCTVMNE